MQISNQPSFEATGLALWSVTRDIKAWYPKVKNGGWICGHDIDRVTVKQAVTEFFKDDKIIYDEERTWFVQKK